MLISEYIFIFKYFYANLYVKYFQIGKVLKNLLLKNR